MLLSVDILWDGVVVKLLMVIEYVELAIRDERVKLAASSQPPAVSPAPTRALAPPCSFIIFIFFELLVFFDDFFIFFFFVVVVLLFVFLLLVLVFLVLLLFTSSFSPSPFRRIIDVDDEDRATVVVVLFLTTSFGLPLAHRSVESQPPLRLRILRRSVLNRDHFCCC